MEVNFKELIAQVRATIEQVRSQLGDEDVTKVFSTLKTIENESVELQGDIKRVSGEAKSKRLAIQDLETKLSDKESEIETLKKNSDNSELTKEVETLRTFKANTIKGQRDSFAAKFNTISKHPKFDKVKQFYRLPDPDKDGNYDLSKMEDADLEFNIGKLAEHEAAEMFGKVEKPGVHGSPRLEHPNGSEKPGEIKSEEDLMSEFDKGFSELE